VVVLGQQLAGDIERHAVGPVAADGVGELAGDLADRLVPAHPLAADLRVQQAAFEPDRFAEVRALGTQAAAVGRMFGIAGYGDLAFTAYGGSNAAADSAIGAGGADGFH